MFYTILLDGSLFHGSWSCCIECHWFSSNYFTSLGSSCSPLVSSPLSLQIAFPRHLNSCTTWTCLPWIFNLSCVLFQTYVLRLSTCWLKPYDLQELFSNSSNSHAVFPDFPRSTSHQRKKSATVLLLWLSPLRQLGTMTHKIIFVAYNCYDGFLSFFIEKRLVKGFYAKTKKKKILLTVASVSSHTPTPEKSGRISRKVGQFSSLHVFLLPQYGSLSQRKVGTQNNVVLQSLPVKEVKERRY